MAENYPNELLLGRLWLGNWHHAADASIIETLKITHILNISDTCENYLEKSHRKSFDLIVLAYLTYLHLCMHDTKDSQINSAFKQIFNFIDAAIVPEPYSPIRKVKKDPLQVLQYRDYPVSN